MRIQIGTKEFEQMLVGFYNHRKEMQSFAMWLVTIGIRYVRLNKKSLFDGELVETVIFESEKDFLAFQLKYL